MTAASETSGGSILVSGFHGIAARGGATPSAAPALHWLREPRRPDGSAAWGVSPDGQSLTVAPPARSDFWRRTYYEPVILKDDGPLLYARLRRGVGDGKAAPGGHCTVEARFALRAARQFDQAGVMVRLGHRHWIKAGLELVDGRPRLSCVVTNAYSDWSTQPWSDFAREEGAAAVVVASDGTTPTPTAAAVVLTAHCHIRVHVRGDSFVVEAKATGGDWEFIRIAHLSKRLESTDGATEEADTHSRSPDPPDNELWAGVFACCPEDQQGGEATFSLFQITEGSCFDHHANGNMD